MNSSYECKEAATAFGKTIKSDIDAQPGWCIFYNNEVYWDVPGGGLWKREAQEICSNEGIIFPPGGTNSNIKIYYYSRLKCICIYDDFFVSQNAPTDAEHAKPALADVGALVRIGVAIAMLIKKRTVECANMKVSRKINEI